MDPRVAALHALDRDGACLWPEALAEDSLQALEAALTGGPLLERRPIGLEALAEWLRPTFFPGLAAEVLGPGARPVRALLMGKGESENWAIAFHQDTTLALKAYREVPGFGHWVNKAHFYHVQAPAAVMEAMLATRIHLDDCGEGNGPLKVLPGSHTDGRLDEGALAARVAAGGAFTIHAGRGGIVLMRPLALHGSDRATAPAPRRVLHIEWVAEDLPGGLEWAWF
ncbi:MAG: phytanoyl-CoA dioxygenase family protein [Holophagaceae bacterium]|nr:phytanoyl-CoA dioxygenase family protein [Holophagaceae bacterium]